MDGRERMGKDGDGGLNYLRFRFFVIRQDIMLKVFPFIYEPYCRFFESRKILQIKIEMKG